MRVDLLRHGEIHGKNTYCGITNHQLTDFGWQQMIDACVRTSDWEKIISSPLIRCAKFATYLSETLDIPLDIDPRWQEMNFGLWDGLSAEEILKFDKEKLYAFWENPSRQSPTNGESLKTIQLRVLSAWEELRSEQKTLLVIAHGGPMRIVHCHHHNHPIERLMEIDVPYASLHSYER